MDVKKQPTIDHAIALKNVLNIRRCRDDRRNVPPQLSIPHIDMMLDRLAAGEILGEKAHRWIGWIHAALVAAGFCEFAEIMELSSQHFGPPVTI